MTHKANILIVDDLPENLKLLTELMSGNNYYVRPVTSGKLALSAAQAIPPDLILLDINMPFMDGFETCQRLKASDITKHIPVIFLSANHSTSDIIKGFECGAIDYITKPFHSTEVLIRIKTHLDLKFSKETILQQNHEQQELIHILCHDLLNSVGAVQSILNMQKMENEFSEEDELMLMATNNAVEVIDLVKQIRSIDEEKVGIELNEFNLKELLDTSYSIVNEKLQQKNIELIIDVDESLNVIVERISFINSILNNLLTNAIKFSFSDSKIIISAQQIEQQIELSVKDFGIGMPAQLQKDIFEVEKVTTREGTNGELGTGFGMPLVKKFVLAYDGKIEVISQEKIAGSEEHGTEVKLFLKTSLTDES